MFIKRTKTPYKYCYGAVKQLDNGSFIIYTSENLDTTNDLNVLNDYWLHIGNIRETYFMCAVFNELIRNHIHDISGENEDFNI